MIVLITKSVTKMMVIKKKIYNDKEFYHIVIMEIGIVMIVKSYLSDDCDSVP